MADKLKLTEIIDDAIREVAELPNRNSPANWPEAMLVTEEELRTILEEAFRTFILTFRGTTPK